MYVFAVLLIIRIRVPAISGRALVTLYEADLLFRLFYSYGFVCCAVLYA